MQSNYYIPQLNQAIVLSKQAFASGGEGELYEVLSPQSLEGYVAKIYHPKKRTTKRAEKIQYLVLNPPFLDYQGEDKPLIWPTHLLQNNQKEFVGFLMPRAEGESLEVLCSPQLPKTLGAAWRKLARGNETSEKLRLKVCYNTAVALQIIHQTNRYVLVDLKSENILLQQNGVVSLVDIDSIEVIENGETIFPATVVTPEYTPPEYYKGEKPGQTTIATTWDRFSLGVIFYRLLFGVHPFAATAKAPHDTFTSLGDKIAKGLFVHNPMLKHIFDVVPPPHKRFLYTYHDIQELFQQTFSIGHEAPNKRPTAKEWIAVLSQHPLLLSDRPLPSSSVDLPKLRNRNWYKIAVEDILQEKKLALPTKKEQIKKTRVDTEDSATMILTDLQEYLENAQSNISVLLKRTLQFTGLLAFALIILVGMDNGGYFWRSFMEWWDNIAFGNIISFLFAGAITVFFMPMFWIMLKHTLGLKKGNRRPTNHLNLWMRLAFSGKQKSELLEETKYRLYKQRSKIKKELKKLNDKLGLLNTTKQHFEHHFYKENKEEIDDSTIAIQGHLKPHLDSIKSNDLTAKKWMQEEADLLRACHKELLEQLMINPDYSHLKGETPQQKITHLKYTLEVPGNNIVVIRNAERIEAELIALDNEYQKKIAQIKADYDDKYERLYNETAGVKLQIDELLKQSSQIVREKVNIEEGLFHKNFQKQLKNIRKHQENILIRKDELEEVNEKIAKIKEELRVLKPS